MNPTSYVSEEAARKLIPRIAPPAAITKREALKVANKRVSEKFGDLHPKQKKALARDLAERIRKGTA